MLDCPGKQMNLRVQIPAGFLRYITLTNYEKQAKQLGKLDHKARGKPTAYKEGDLPTLSKQGTLDH